MNRKKYELSEEKITPDSEQIREVKIEEKLAFRRHFWSKTAIFESKIESVSRPESMLNR